MIKIIIFDLGGVIIDYDHYMYYDYLSKRNKIDKEVFIKTLDPLSQEIDGDKISLEQLEARLAKAIKISQSKIQYNKSFDKISKVNNDVVKIARELSKRYKLAILSNASAGHYKIVRKKLKDIRIFSKVYISYKMRATKPGKKIYRDVIGDLSLRPSELLFIDNAPDNIRAARKAGMKGIVFKNPQQLNADLKSVLKDRTIIAGQSPK